MSETHKRLFTEQQIKDRVKELALDIARHYAGKGTLYMCPIMDGAKPFHELLLKHLAGCSNLRIEQHPISCKSYKGEQAGELKVVGMPVDSLKGKHVLLVEDILDTGQTLSFLTHKFKTLGPDSVEVAVMLDKKKGLHFREGVDLERASHIHTVKPKFTGWLIEDLFVIGFGMDLDEQYRELPYIAVRV